MNLRVCGKVTGLFLVLHVLTACALGLGFLGIIGQLQPVTQNDTDYSVEQVRTDALGNNTIMPSPNRETWQRARSLMLVYILVTMVVMTLLGVWVLRLGLTPSRRGITEKNQGQDTGGKASAEADDVATMIHRMAEDLRNVATGIRSSTCEVKQPIPSATRTWGGETFVTMVIHDLKAPLRGIKTLAQWLVQDYGDRLDPQGHEQIQLLVRRVQRMEDMIAALLRYARSEDKHVTIESVDVYTLVQDVLEGLVVPDHITVHVEEDLPSVNSDATWLRQIFQNLISNAVKYTDNAPGQVRVCGQEIGTDNWEFRVEDNGPGIAPRYHTKIFEMFETLCSRDDRESTGIGLAVVKQSLAKLGGHIWIESEEGQGCTFVFTLPRLLEERQDHEEHKTCTACGR